MFGECENCPSHLLTTDDFTANNNESGEGEDPEFSHYTWTKDVKGYVVKAKQTSNLTDVLSLWEDTVVQLKKHIYRKRVQFMEIEKIKRNLSEGQLLTHIDYSEIYKAKQQNEIQSASGWPLTFEKNKANFLKK